MLDNLLSKVIAAGLAAGVFLLWWPAHLPSNGVGWLVLRGLAWTLAFEILVLSFVPLEQMATRALTRRRAASRASHVRSRLAAAPAPARASGAVMLAFTGLLLPGLLLLHSGRLPSTQRAAHTTKVVRKVVVRKVVRERTVVVREAAPAAPAPYAASPAPATTAEAPKASAEAPAKKTSTPKKIQPSSTTKTAAKKTTSTPATTKTTPAAPVLPDPPAAAAPAGSDATPAGDATAAAG